MTAQPLWENEEWAIYEDELRGNGSPYAMPTGMRRDEIDPDMVAGLFEFCLEMPGTTPDLLYDAFLQLAYLWDLQCNYDELRKIRDQAKQEKTG